MTTDDPRVGATIAGRYRVLAPLGAGGMGVVYRAERIGAGRIVAMKFLRNTAPEFVRRFQREVAAASRLSHPHLAEIVDSGVDDEGAPFLVMEFVAGRSLGEVLEHGALPAGRAVTVARQILAGLQHAHTGGIIHRDLKPDNVVLLERSDDDFVKVLDFGLAKIVRGEGEREALTVTGITMGTPSFIAPEQARGEPVDRRADLYSVGVLLYQMVVGRKPFVAEHPLQVLRMHLEAAPEPPRVAAPGCCSAELEAAILRALEKQPPRRWQTAQDFAQALAVTPEGRQSTAPPLTTTPAIRRALDQVRNVQASIPVPAPAAPAAPAAPHGMQPVAAPRAPAARGRKLPLFVVLVVLAVLLAIAAAVLLPQLFPQT